MNKSSNEQRIPRSGSPLSLPDLRRRLLPFREVHHPKADEMQVVKDICTYCQVRRGMDYILIKKKTRGDANDNDR